ncbi:hypothetical protein [Priestia endophytica]|uniref:hypothetical protein n=1 Tax=Priestia endophytica TaxID=135735 RepID=UPI003D2A6B4F
MNNKDNQDFDIEAYKQLKTRDISRNIGIGESTVRKYAQYLEDKGYSFRKDEAGGRIFRPEDELAIQELKKLREEGKIGLEMAAAMVTTRRNEKNKNVSPIQSMQPSSNKDSSLNNIDNIIHVFRHTKEEMAITINEEISVIRKELPLVVREEVKQITQHFEQLLEDKEKEKEEAMKNKDEENKKLSEKVDQLIEVVQRLEEQQGKRGFWSKLFS